MSDERMERSLFFNNAPDGLGAVEFCSLIESLLKEENVVTRFDSSELSSGKKRIEVELKSTTYAKALLDKVVIEVEVNGKSYRLPITTVRPNITSKSQRNGNVTESKRSMERDDLHQDNEMKLSANPVTWFDLLQSHEDLFVNDKCILVQSTFTDLDEGQLRSYFEGQVASGGCPVQRMIRVFDGILIEFVEKEYAVKVASNKNHFIGDQKLHVYRKNVPAICDDRLIIEGNCEDTSTLLTKCQKLDIKTSGIKNIESDLPNHHLVRFSQSKDISAIAMAFKNHVKDIKVKKICHTDCIRVRNLANLNDGVIKLEFMKLNCYVTMILRYPDDDEAIIYFADYKDSQKVMKMAKHTPLEMNGITLKLSICNCLQRFHDIWRRRFDASNGKPPIKKLRTTSKEYNATSTNTHTSHQTVQESPCNLQQYVYTPKINFDKIEFVIRSTSHMTEFSRQFDNFAEVKIMKSATKISEHKIQFEPSLEQQNDTEMDQHKFERKCRDLTDRFFQNFVSETCVVKSLMQIPETGAWWDGKQFVESENNENLWPVLIIPHKNGIFKVVGTSAEVESFIHWMHKRDIDEATTSDEKSTAQDQSESVQILTNEASGSEIESAKPEAYDVQQKEDTISSKTSDKQTYQFQYMPTADNDVVEYVHKSPHLREDLLAKFRNLAHVKFSVDTKSSRMRIDFQPLAEEGDVKKNFEEECVELSKKFLGSFSIDSFRNDKKILDLIRQKHKLVDEIFNREIDGNTIRVYLRWKDQSPLSAVKVIGSHDHVKLFLIWLKDQCKSIKSDSSESEIDSDKHEANQTQDIAKSSETPDKQTYQFQYTWAPDSDLMEYVLKSPLLRKNLSEKLGHLAKIKLSVDAKTSRMRIAFQPLASLNVKEKPFEEECVAIMKKYFSSFDIQSSRHDMKILNFIKNKHKWSPGILKMDIDKKTTHVFLRWKEESQMCIMKMIGSKDHVNLFMEWLNSECKSPSNIANASEAFDRQQQEAELLKKEQEIIPPERSTWFKLLQSDDRFLFTGFENRCIVVQNVPQTCTYSKLRSYFEDEQKSGGGSVLKMFRIMDGILIAFKDSSTAASVIRQTKHNIDEEPLNVCLKQVPTIDDRRLILGVTCDAENFVRTFMEGFGDKGLKLNVIKIRKSQYMVEYHRATDIDKIIKDVHAMSLGKHKAKAARVSRSDCVRIENVARFDDDQIKLPFMKLLDCLNCVTLVERDANGNAAFVYFADFRDADRAYDASKKLKLEIGDTEIQLSLYSKDIFEKYTNKQHSGIADGAMAANNPKPSTSKSGQLKEFKNQVKAESSDIIDAILSLDEFKVAIAEEFAGLAQVEFIKKRPRFHVIMKPVLQQRKDFGGDQKQFESHCCKKLDEFLAKFSSDFHRFPEETIKNMQKRFKGKGGNMYEFNENGIYLIIKWNKEEAGKLKLIGFLDDVKKVKEMYGTHVESKQFTDLNLCILVKCGIISSIKIANKVEITIDKQNHTLKFEGSKPSVMSAKSKMVEKLKKVSKSDMSFLHAAQQKFLHEFLHMNSARDDVNVADKINEKFKELHINGFLQLNGDLKLICAQEDHFIMAKEVIGNIIQMFETRLTIDADDWMQLQAEICSLGAVRIYGNDHNLTVSLVGLDPYFNEARRRLDDCIDDNKESEVSVKLEFLQKYFFCNFPSEVDLDENLRDIEWYEADEGISLSGKSCQIKKAATWIRQTADSFKISNQPLTETWKAKYLKGPSGKQFLKTTESACSCAVQLSKSEWRREAPPLPVAKVPISSQSNSKIPFAEIPGTKVAIRVIKDDITTHRCDAIVNASNGQLELRNAGVSGSIMRKGGRIIQQEMNDHRRKLGGYLRPGCAVTTSAGHGSLPCKKIVHVFGPIWSGSRRQESVNCLKKSVISCLLEAKKNNLKSIAIPAISCGVFGGEANVCAPLIVEAIVEHFKGDDGKHSSVKMVDLIEISNRTIVDEFRKQLNKLSNSYTTGWATSANSATNAPPMHEQTVPFHVTVMEGDILTSDCDGIVNTVGRDFDLTLSQLSRKLLEKAGDTIKTECAHFPKYTAAMCRVTSGGKLRCKYIIHLVIPNEVSRISDALREAFTVAEDMKIPSLAIPALGLGNAGLNQQSVIQSMRRAIEEFQKTNPKYLKEIKVVIFHKYLLRDFKSAFANVSRLPANQMDSISVTLMSGGILLSSCDAIVYPTSDEFEASEKLLSLAGANVRTELAHNPLFHSSAFKMTSGGLMNCKYIVHLKKPKNVADITTQFQEVFTLVEVMNLQSVAIPALSLKKFGGFKESSVVDAIKSAIVNFANGIPNGEIPTHLRRIEVVLPDSWPMDKFRSLATSYPIKKKAITSQSIAIPQQDEPSTSRANPSVQYHGMKLWFCSSKQENIDKAWDNVCDQFERQSHKKNFEHPRLKMYNIKDQKFISALEIENNVCVKKPKEHESVLTITGLQEDVWKAYQKLQSEFETD